MNPWWERGMMVEKENTLQIFASGLILETHARMKWYS